MLRVLNKKLIPLTRKTHLPKRVPPRRFFADENKNKNKENKDRESTNVKVSNNDNKASNLAEVAPESNSSFPTLWRDFDPFSSVDRFFGHPFFPQSRMPGRWSDRWDPLSDFFDSGFRTLSTDRRDWYPKTDISETDEHVVIAAELPGIKKEDIQINVKEGMLEIKGEKKQESKFDNKNRKYSRVERSYGSFIRRLELPYDVKPEEIKAKFDHGVLTINVPKSAPNAEGTSVKID
eukprot:TRINITY_DN13851_c0_g1_i1.p1 TRINITY_DN13851_c0_g1~~TRINITY_DN13851_c0_g1_i1.p1  ORF type:complete len:235 (+),score=43.55 TRINITY_DN13851_c0_g1_i1:44-748(+)